MKISGFFNNLLENSEKMSEILKNIEDAETAVDKAISDGRKGLPTILKAASNKHSGEMIYMGMGQVAYYLKGDGIYYACMMMKTGGGTDNISYEAFAKRLSKDGLKAVSEKLAGWGF